MYIDYLPSYYIWCFYSNNVISITKDMELYSMIEQLMNNQYEFNDNDFLKNYKDNNYLKWYSDLYYNPDNELSYKSISYLNIKKENDKFLVWCVRPIDEIITSLNKLYMIAFVPAFNGTYSRNISTGLSFQDDFVLVVYQKLINNCKKLSKNR